MSDLFSDVWNAGGCIRCIIHTISLIEIRKPFPPNIFTGWDGNRMAPNCRINSPMNLCPVFINVPFNGNLYFK